MTRTVAAKLLAVLAFFALLLFNQPAAAATTHCVTTGYMQGSGQYVPDQCFATFQEAEAFLYSQASGAGTAEYDPELWQPVGLVLVEPSRNGGYIKHYRYVMKSVAPIIDTGLEQFVFFYAPTCPLLPKWLQLHGAFGDIVDHYGTSTIGEMWGCAGGDPSLYQHEIEPSREFGPTKSWTPDDRLGIYEIKNRHIFKPLDGTLGGGGALEVHYYKCDLAHKFFNQESLETACKGYGGKIYSFEAGIETGNGCETGNPCNVATGSKTQREDDFTWAGGRFFRTYVSSAEMQPSAAFGLGWTHNYESFGFKVDIDAYLVWFQGSYEQFKKGVSTSSYLSTNIPGSELVLTANGFRIHMRDGRVADYSRDYQTGFYLLQRLDTRDPATSVSLTYCGTLDSTCPLNAVKSVTTDLGRSLSFTYGDLPQKKTGIGLER